MSNIDFDHFDLPDDPPNELFYEQFGYIENLPNWLKGLKEKGFWGKAFYLIVLFFWIY